MLKRNKHFCQVNDLPRGTATTVPSVIPALPVASKTLHSSSVQVDPDNILPQETQLKFQSLLKSYDTVFDPNIKGYNGAAGPFEAKVNMGPVEPPQRKGRLPQYGRRKLVELQEKFDHLEALGVFHLPEKADVTVEYLNPSFLVRKPNGEYRLVTAFADVGPYSKGHAFAYARCRFYSTPNRTVETHNCHRPN